MRLNAHNIGVRYVLPDRATNTSGPRYRGRAYLLIRHAQKVLASRGTFQQLLDRDRLAHRRPSRRSKARCSPSC